MLFFIFRILLTCSFNFTLILHFQIQEVPCFVDEILGLLHGKRLTFIISVVVQYYLLVVFLILFYCAVFMFYFWFHINYICFVFQRCAYSINELSAQKIIVSELVRRLFQWSCSHQWRTWLPIECRNTIDRLLHCKLVKLRFIWVMVSTCHSIIN